MPTWRRKSGGLIIRFGERAALTLEYLGLVLIFTGYAFVEVAWMAVVLYVLDHLLFAMAIAIKSYFQKIADPADMASTAGVSFTINHIAAVVIPVSFGIIWLYSPAVVFLAGAVMAALSLLLSRMVPRNPCDGNEVRPPLRSLSLSLHVTVLFAHLPQTVVKSPADLGRIPDPLDLWPGSAAALHDHFLDFRPVRNSRTFFQGSSGAFQDRW